VTAWRQAIGRALWDRFSTHRPADGGCDLSYAVLAIPLEVCIRNKD